MGNVKGRLPETGRFFRHGGMKKVSFHGPEDFSGIGKCKNNSLGGGKNFPVLTAGFFHP
jgi:hypothetical protein